MVLHEGQWHGLLYDKRAFSPYLGDPKPEVHEFDIEPSEPSESESGSESEEKTHHRRRNPSLTSSYQPTSRKNRISRTLPKKLTRYHISTPTSNSNEDNKQRQHDYD